MREEMKLSSDDMIMQCAPQRIEIVKNIGNSKGRTQEQKQKGKESIEKFIQDHEGKDVMVFTDGSIKMRKPAENLPPTLGFGACASVLIPPSKTHIIESKYVGTLTNNVECEVAGIMLALEQTVHWIQKNRNLNRSFDVYVLCDCTSAIDIVINQSDIKTRLEILRNIWKSLNSLKNIGIQVFLIWCPGHCDIIFNDLADETAKKAAEELSNMVTQNDSVTQLDQSTLQKIIREDQTKAWQLSWTRATAGAATRELMPSVRSKVTWSGSRSSDISYARSLLNSTNLNEHRYYMKFAESPNCECGKDRETVSHFLLYCENFEKERKVMYDLIMEVWMNKKAIGSLNITKEILIGPKFSDKLNAEEDARVKMALFQFLQEAKDI